MVLVRNLGGESLLRARAQCELPVQGFGRNLPYSAQIELVGLAPRHLRMRIDAFTAGGTTELWLLR